MRRLLSIFILISTLGCIESFTPEIEGYSDSLVVEGHILEGANPATVKISRSFAFDQRDPPMVKNAAVAIQDDEGNETLLREISDGVYQSDTTQLKGVPGRSYQLTFELSSGEYYESSWVVMKKSVPIEKLTSKFITINDGLGETQGMQVFVNSFDPENQSQYYRWEYEETWIFFVPYPATGIWNLQTSMPEFYSPDQIPAVCWQTDSSSKIYISSSVGLEEDRIVDFPIRYISNRTNRLRSKYSILVKQFILSSETFEFYRKLKSFTENLGTLSDPIPSEIRGNILNINQPEEQVIGMFSADGFSSKRIFISRQDFPQIYINNGFESCPLDTLINIPSMDSYIKGGGIFVGNLYNELGFWIGYGGTRRACGDCTANGVLEEPDFWE